jgi:nitroreductase
MSSADNPRKTEAPADRLFVDRWSPRAFSPEHLSGDTVAALFEAARWSPSCANEQPWLFVYARSDEDRERFLSLLAPGNQRWARRAPLLVFAAARRTWADGGEPNRHHAFDTGAAWMALALQARLLGLYTHAMAGFDEERSYEVLGLSKKEYEVMAAIAVGKRGDAGELPEDLQRREHPGGRKPLSEVAVEGRLGRKT